MGGWLTLRSFGKSQKLYRDDHRNGHLLKSESPQRLQRRCLFEIADDSSEQAYCRSVSEKTTWNPACKRVCCMVLFEKMTSEAWLYSKWRLPKILPGRLSLSKWFSTNTPSRLRDRWNIPERANRIPPASDATKIADDVIVGARQRRFLDVVHIDVERMALPRDLRKPRR